MEAVESVAVSMRAGRRLLAFRAGQYFFLFIASLIVARILGPDGRAEYALPLALAMTTSIVAHLSMDSSALRLLGRKEADASEVSRLLALSTVLLGCAGAGLCVGIGLLVREDLLAGASGTSVLLAGAMVPFLMATQMGATLLVFLGSLRQYGWILLIGAGLLVVLLIGAQLLWRLNPESTLGAWLVWNAATAVAVALTLSRSMGSRALVPTARWKTLTSALRTGAVLHLSSIAHWLNLRLDLFLVSLLAGQSATGLYSLSASLSEFVGVAAWTIALAAIRTQTTAEPSLALERTLAFVRQNLVFAGAITVGMCILAYPFVLVLYGREWLGSVPSLVLLSIGALAFAIEGPARLLLVRLGRPISVSLVTLTALTLNVALNLTLIPSLELTGAAIASLVSYWTAALLMLLVLGRATGYPARRTFQVFKPAARWRK